jgi:hypothetical protein
MKTDLLFGMGMYWDDFFWIYKRVSGNTTATPRRKETL